MTKKLARLLRADIQETSDLKSIAKMLANKGRGNDTLLAHITPREVKILKAAGGSGTVNPETGLMEFDDGFDYYQIAPDIQPAETFSPEVASGEVAASPQSTEAAPQAATQDFYYQPSTPVELTSPEAAQPTGQAPAPANVFGVPAVQSPAPVSSEARKAVEQQAAAQASGGGTAAGDQRSFLQRFVGDPLASLKKETGLTGADLLRVGGAGAGAIVGRQQAKKAAEQIQEATQEQKNVGQPYQQAGTELQRAAMSGELTPQSAQAYQAMRAQLAQGVESRGGVGVAQAQAQTEAFRQQLLANQYNLGLQVSQIGDNIALGAIRTGMQLDQQLNQANQQFYTQLAAIAGGGTYGFNPQQVRGTP
jgi:hypothetical protein